MRRVFCAATIVRLARLLIKLHHYCLTKHGQDLQLIMTLDTIKL